MRKSMFGTDAGNVLEIPDEPYSIPKNWCWTYWGNCGLFVVGSAFKEIFQGNRDLNIPFYKVGSLKYSNNYGYLCESDNTIDEEIRKRLKASLIPENSIIFAKVGETIRLNRRSLNPSPCCIDNNLMAFISNDECYFKYVFYWSKSVDLFAYTKSTTVPTIRKTDLEKIPFPLAPYNKQIEIVKHIESLFLKLDKAKEKVQKVLDNFEVRRASILHKAFAGELTAKWRKENGIGDCSWINKSIEELCYSLNRGTPKKSQPEGSVVVIRMRNLQYGEIDWTNLAYTKDQEDVKKYKLYPGDVLFNKTNSAAVVGKTAIYRGDYPAIYSGYLIKLDYNHNLVLGDYLNYALNTAAAKKYCNSVKTDGVNQSNINAKKLGSFVIPVASMAEQQEIVRIVRTIFEKESQTRLTAEKVVEQIEIIKRSILVRAFRGKLGTNTLEDENAKNLLNRILIEKADEKEKQLPETKKRITIPKEIEALISSNLERKIVKLFLKNEIKELPVEELMSVSFKTFDVLEALRSLERKQLIVKLTGNIYKLTK